MAFSLTKASRFLTYILYAPPFVIAFICFSWHLAYTHLGYKPSIPAPDADYEVKYRICQEDCVILRELYCGEWIDHRHPKLCEYVCDSYLEHDILTYSPTMKAILTCVRDATTRKEVEACKLSCSYMEEL